MWRISCTTYTKHTPITLFIFNRLIRRYILYIKRYKDIDKYIELPFMGNNKRDFVEPQTMTPPYGM